MAPFVWHDYDVATGIGNPDSPTNAANLTAAFAEKAPIASPTFTGTVGGVTAAMVGLGSVDNTSDAAKPVSTAQAAAIAGVSTPTARFKGSLLSSVTVTAGSNIPFTTLDDPAARWNSSTKLWVCPVAGTYIVIGSIKMNGTGVATSIIILKNGTSAITSPNLPSAAWNGGTVTGYLRLAIGDTMAMQVNTTYTTQSDTPADNNYLELVQVQF